MQAQKIVFNLHVDNPMNAGMMRPGLNQAEIVEIETAAEVGRNFEMNVVVFRSETFAQARDIIVVEACATAVFGIGIAGQFEKAAAQVMITVKRAVHFLPGLRRIFLFNNPGRGGQAEFGNFLPYRFVQSFGVGGGYSFVNGRFGNLNVANAALISRLPAADEIVVCGEQGRGVTVRFFRGLFFDCPV